ncbi:MAG: bifunctional (p)ppGpp synthetase/guanosine-3',5'-bis(diphosphate) 3'-pyrophosphohydrolase [Bacteroidales bacterium]|nr:bifunctional (p)ppGpp synthetase/guanosine-3',5'-bis(diphosphate) 3'-pyrophosphohydrolase [Bacteroidales bacterium]
MSDYSIDSVNKKYLEYYNDVLEGLNQSMIEKQNELLEKAFLLFHENRKGDKTFYKKDVIISVLDASKIAVNEIGLGYTSIIGLFVYHARVKEKIAADTIKKNFGDAVETIADGLAKVSDIKKETTSSQAENFRRLLLSLAKDVRVILIRLAEQTELMREMKQMTEEERIRVAAEASYLYAPLAHRLGLYLIKSEMEDISLKYTNRSEYNMIARKLAETMKTRNKFIDEFIQPLKNTLNKQGFVYDIIGRPKSIFSIWIKMKRKGVQFEDIYDLFAIRIILKSELTNEKADCWQAYSAVTDIYQPNPLRLRDWISIPKTNGYESLHTTVIGPDGRWVEVQIRTERMNEIAEKGVAAHWKYKGLDGEQGLEEWLRKIREILETPEPDADSFIDDFKLSLYSKEIFVFTPKGDLRKFPEGASVLDFAYDIHTDVGSTCIGARVNGKTMPIRYKMQNGDRIEILTAKNQFPKLDWLNFVVTSKAQKKIRQQLNEDKVKEAENGKEIIKRRFKNWKIDYTDDAIRKLLKHYKLPNAQEFYCDISLNKIDLSEVKEVVSAQAEKPEDETSVLEDLEVTRKPAGKKPPPEDYLIIDEKVANIDFKLAKCCSPIMGDPIFGFVTINEGIKIHRINCPNAVQLIGKYGYRVVKAKWTRKGPEPIFPVNIIVTGEDYSRILKSVSEVLAKDLKVNVRSIAIDEQEGMFIGKINLLVRNIQHLDALISQLSSIKGIYSVSRAERN